MRILVFISLAVLLFSSCAKVYHTPDYEQKASTHQVLAIAPPHVSIDARKDVSGEAMADQRKTESINIQQEMFAWVLKRKQKGDFVGVEIMDPQTVNAKLSKKGWPEKYLSPLEMAEIIGVDAVISSSFSMKKPMSTGGAIASTIFFGVGISNEVMASINIYDREAEKLIWNFDHEVDGGVASSADRLVNKLMRKASRKMPY